MEIEWRRKQVALMHDSHFNFACQNAIEHFHHLFRTQTGKEWGMSDETVASPRQLGCILFSFCGPVAGAPIDWCCFYYLVRNSLVALLEALCARIFSFRFVNIGFVPEFLCVCVCVCKVSRKALLPPLSTRILCLVVSIPLVCWLYMCACVCVPLYVHVKMCR